MKIAGARKRPAKAEFQGRFSKDGGLDFPEYTRKRLKQFIRENPGAPFRLEPIIAESSSQRRWFEGALVPLVCFFQAGMDHRDSKDRQKVREWLKIEFNGDLVAVGGKTHKVAQSTSQKLNTGFLERVTDWLLENYAPPFEALNPKDWKHWHDAVFPYGGPDNYIDYLLERKILKKQ